MRRHERFPLCRRTWMLRLEQVQTIEELADQRPGSNASGILREIVALGLPLYSQQQQVLRSLLPPTLVQTP